MVKLPKLPPGVFLKYFTRILIRLSPTLVNRCCPPFSWMEASTVVTVSDLLRVAWQVGVRSSVRQPSHQALLALSFCTIRPPRAGVLTFGVSFYLWWNLWICPQKKAFFGMQNSAEFQSFHGTAHQPQKSIHEYESSLILPICPEGLQHDLKRGSALGRRNKNLTARE